MWRVVSSIVVATAVAACTGCNTALAPERGDLVGVVFDETGLPVAGAVVSVDGDEARSDLNGRFAVRGVALGDMTIRVVCEGYLPLEEAVFRSHRSEIAYLRIESIGAARQRARRLFAEGNPMEAARLANAVAGATDAAIDHFLVALALLATGVLSEARAALDASIAAGGANAATRELVHALESQEAIHD